MKKHFTASIFKLYATNRNRVRSIISGTLLNLSVALSFWYGNQKYLLVTVGVFNLHSKGRQNTMKYLVCTVRFNNLFIFCMQLP